MFYTIDNDNAITAFDAKPAPEEGALLFTSNEELETVTSEWPLSRLAETWNGFAGVPPFGDLKPVKKFENRPKALRRIWAAISAGLQAQHVHVTEATIAEAEPTAPEPPAPELRPYGMADLLKVVLKDSIADLPKPTRVRKSAENSVDSGPKPERGPSRKETIFDLVSREGGATLQEIMAATGWQRHSVRGFISTANKNGARIDSLKNEAGDRVYRIAPAAETPAPETPAAEAEPDAVAA